MTDKEAMKLALEALDNLMYWDNGKPDFDDARTAIKALEEAITKQSAERVEQGKPIAWYDPSNGVVSTDKNSASFTPLGQVVPLYDVALAKQEQGEPVERKESSADSWDDRYGTGGSYGSGGCYGTGGGFSDGGPDGY